jgi:putative endonuclease
METGTCVYMLANQPYGTLYIGVTSDLVRRVCEHRNGFYPGTFTKRYGIKTLVWYEVHTDGKTAVRREKQFKKWERRWKIRLIERENPTWRDLFYDICEF